MKTLTLIRGTPGSWKICRGFSLLEMLIAMVLSVVLLTSLFSLYYGAARGAAKDASRSVADNEARMINHRLSRDFKLAGLIPLQDCNGDSNDVTRDVPSQPWSDSLRQDFEYANTYDVVFTCDIDNDGFTETVQYYRDNVANRLMQKTWEWSRDSIQWNPPVERSVASNVDYIMFTFYDRDGNSIPNPLHYPSGGYTLSYGERSRITAVEIIVVTRSDRAENGHSQMVYAPDGHYWYDDYHRTIQQFLVRGRNLSLGA